ncbi:hypothetical protein Pa4123_50940 [Phytohabitans aurantiacus]|uniref:Uncharacterized protein n=1 Tax=Phytohabitans aurantiacus TaxID=3016789 RepID=A0ABQ5R0K0_9ACTN|nr:hypothetical protein Pa4123_50940 [Phytohabitans aurantiacus]
MRSFLLFKAYGIACPLSVADGYGYGAAGVAVARDDQPGHRLRRATSKCDSYIVREQAPTRHRPAAVTRPAAIAVAPGGRLPRSQVPSQPGAATPTALAVV